MSRDRGCNLYVSKISSRVSIGEIERLFSKYGRIRDIHLKSDYGFILFEDSRDADDAVHYLDGYELDGKRLIVEHKRGAERQERRRSRSRSRERARGPERAAGAAGPNGESRCFNCGKTGHWARDCKEGDWKNKCYRCQKSGHIERHCPENPDREVPAEEKAASKSKSVSRSRSRSPPRGRSRSASRYTPGICAL